MPPELLGDSEVSILVLLEPPLIPKLNLGHHNGLSVSILVLLEPPLIPFATSAAAVDLPVSILVLLEPPLILSGKI